ncbi:MAG: transcription termination/antitermination protein NusA [Chloroflexi bacterium]|nr:transcription termination/antitermination protein NusA [Chloroflexota bacterium]
MKSEFIIAITQLAAERNLPRDVVLNAVEAALISAFKKDYLADMDLAVRISFTTGEVHVFAKRTVVADGAVEDANSQVSLSDAQKLKPDVQLGYVFEKEVTPANAGRIAAQTAKQVVIQRLREAERDIVFSEYATKEGDVVSAVVQRFDGRSVILDLGRAEAVMPPAEQTPSERYRPSQRLKVLILEVGKSTRGPQIVVSRTHKNLLKRLFELEVPEVLNKIVEIKAIAREPGFRSKVAVSSNQERVDPVGACVGLRGVRIQNIVNELHGEKIDVVEWSADPAAFIARALAPAQVMHVAAKQGENTAIVVVPDKMLSLAIGREGQNARLAAKLTGWRIDIKSASEAEAQKIDLGKPQAPPAEIAERARAAQPKPVQPPPSVPTSVTAEAPPVQAAAQATPAEAPASAEAPTLAEALASEATWKVPQAAPSASQIRFAEDIAEFRGGKGGKGGKKREGGDTKRRKGGRIEDLAYEEE